MKWFKKLIRTKKEKLGVATELFQTVEIVRTLHFREPDHDMVQYDKSLSMSEQPYPTLVRIVVRDEASKVQFLAALKYVHDKHMLNEECLVLNQLAHLYLTPDVIVVESIET